jgi:hypothetical protein
MTRLPHSLFEQPWPEGEYRFFQLGFVVDDLVAAAMKWVTVFGVGPFHVLPRLQQACTYRGAQSILDFQVAVAQAGPVQVELIQQFDNRPSVLRDLVAHGEKGFHQVCTVTPDYEATKSYYEALGYELRSEIITAEHRVAYVDTIGDFGFFTEVVAETPKFLGQLAQIAQTCAEWDGADPVRILTRDGYRTPER